MFQHFIQVLKKLIEQRQSEVQKVMPGLTCFKEGVRCIPVESIPGIRDTGWRPPARIPRTTRGNDDTDLEVLASQLRTILNQVLSSLLKAQLHLFIHAREKCEY
jgi:histone acetyltransferase